MNWFKRFLPPPPLNEIFVLELYDAIRDKWIMYGKGFLTDAECRRFASEQCAKRPLNWDVMIADFGDQIVSEYFVKPGYDISRFRISRITINVSQNRK